MTPAEQHNTIAGEFDALVLHAVDARRAHALGRPARESLALARDALDALAALLVEPYTDAAAQDIADHAGGRP